MKRFLVLVFVLAVALAGPASGSVQKGDAAIEFLGGWAMENGEGASDADSFLAGSTGDDFDGWLISGALSRFTSNNFQIAFTGFGAWLEGDGVQTSFPLVGGFPGVNQAYDVDVETTVYGIGGRFRWHFTPAKRLVPFVGGQVLWASADVDISGRAAVITDEGEVLPGTEAAVSESDSADGILWGPVVGLRYELSERNDLLVEYEYHLWQGDISDILDDGHAVFVGISHQFK